MKVIYVAGAYRGKDENEVFENIIRARTAALRLWHRGWAVICPHTNTIFMGSMLGDKTFLDGDLEILKRCDAIFMLKDWTRSKGAVEEFRLAHKLGKEILFEETEWK